MEEEQKTRFYLKIKKIKSLYSLRHGIDTLNLPNYSQIKRVPYKKAKELIPRQQEYLADGKPTKRRRRVDAVLAVHLTISATPHFFERDNMIIKSWIDDCTRWIHNTFTNENIVALSVKNEEISKKVTAIIIMAKEGKLDHGFWFGGPWKMRQIQEGFLKTVGESYGLSRKKVFRKKETFV